MKLTEKLRHSELLCLMRNANASDVVRAFLDWLTEMKDKSESSWQVVLEEDNKIQDFLHEMEFEANSKKRSVIATRWHESRVKRRTAKDIAKKLKPICDFHKEASSRNLLKLLRKMLTELRSAEEFINSERVYKPRAVSEEDPDEDGQE